MNLDKYDQVKYYDANISNKLRLDTHYLSKRLDSAKAGHQRAMIAKSTPFSGRHSSQPENVAVDFQRNHRILRTASTNEVQEQGMQVSSSRNNHQVKAAVTTQQVGSTLILAVDQQSGTKSPTKNRPKTSKTDNKRFFHTPVESDFQNKINELIPHFKNLKRDNS